MPLSIIIPAHNEAAVIGRCLRSVLVQGLGANDQVIVICNGCRDNTAEIARSFGERVTVIETSTASKTNALNLGDQAADGFPRFYVDGDVVLEPGALSAMARALQDRAALAAAPTVKHDLAGASWAVKAFYEIDGRLPSRREGIGGSGVYALSEAGRRRFGEFPRITADDAFVRRQFAPSQRVTVPDAFSVVTPPRTLAGVIAIKTRSHFGNYEIAQRFPELSRNRGQGNRKALLSLGLRPWLWAKLAVYGYVKVAARLKARGRIRRAEFTWERDESSRQPSAPAGASQEVSRA